MSGGSFRPENIHVDGENLKFDTLELSNFTEELQEMDYHSLWSMIKLTILKKNIKRLPYDMQHLLKLLENPRYNISVSHHSDDSAHGLWYVQVILFFLLSLEIWHHCGALLTPCLVWGERRSMEVCLF